MLMTKGMLYIWLYRELTVFAAAAVVSRKSPMFISSEYIFTIFSICPLSKPMELFCLPEFGLITLDLVFFPILLSE